MRKVGACPSGYRESGGYCAPTSPRSPDAIPKRGQCPSGFAQSGAHCLKMGGDRRTSAPVLPELWPPVSRRRWGLPQ